MIRYNRETLSRILFKIPPTTAHLLLAGGLTMLCRSLPRFCVQSYVADQYKIGVPRFRRSMWSHVFSLTFKIRSLFECRMIYFALLFAPALEFPNMPIAGSLSSVSFSALPDRCRPSTVQFFALSSFLRALDLSFHEHIFFL